MKPPFTIFTFFSLFLFTTALSFAGNVPIMPVGEVKSGMDGYGLTVFSGDSIERFEVRILGTLKNFLPKKDVILAELQGEKLRYTGVIGGMSGSPIYIDGRLIGALAYGWQFAKEPIVGITPIEQMLEIEKASGAGGAAAPQGGGAPAARTSAAVFNPFKPPANFLLDDSLETGRAAGAGSFAAGGASLARLQIPLIFSGFRPEIIEKYGKAFSRFGLIPLAGGSTGGADTAISANVAPGSAVSAQLIRGDVSLAATGTLTFRDGNRVLAFGHPFLHFGPVDFPLTAAEIVAVLPNVASSFKISNSTSPVGSVRTDHTSGILGVIGAQPRMVPLKASLRIAGLPEETFSYEMVDHKLLSPVLAALSIANSLGPAGDAVTEQTLKVSGRITTKDTPPVVIENLYAGASASGEFIQQLLMMLQYLYNNSYGPARIQEADFSFEVSEGNPRAAVTEVYVDRDEVSPGDTIEIDVVLDPFLKAPFHEKFSFIVPDTEKDSKLFLLVGAANYLTMTEFQISPARFLYTSLEHLVRLINQSRRNDCLYVKVFRMDQGVVLAGREMPELPPSVYNLLRSGKSTGATLPLNDYSLAEFARRTDYVISGLKVIQIDLKARD